MKETFNFIGISAGKILAAVLPFCNATASSKPVLAIIPTPYFIRR
jgi:hypothetical protein